MDKPNIKNLAKAGGKAVLKSVFPGMDEGNPLKNNYYYNVAQTLKSKYDEANKPSNDAKDTSNKKDTGDKQSGKRRESKLDKLNSQATVTNALLIGVLDNNIKQNVILNSINKNIKKLNDNIGNSSGNGINIGGPEVAAGGAATGILGWLRAAAPFAAILGGAVLGTKLQDNMVNNSKPSTDAARIKWLRENGRGKDADELEAQGKKIFEDITKPAVKKENSTYAVKGNSPIDMLNNIKELSKRGQENKKSPEIEELLKKNEKKNDNLKASTIVVNANNIIVNANSNYKTNTSDTLTNTPLTNGNNTQTPQPSNTPNSASPNNNAQGVTRTNGEDIGGTPGGKTGSVPSKFTGKNVNTAVRKDLNDVIENTAKETGFDKNVLKMFSRIESSGGNNKDAYNPNRIGKRALGAMQFIPSTWAKFGQGPHANANDDTMAVNATVKLTRSNAAQFKKIMGRDPNPGEMYLMHQQGVGGAVALLQNPGKNAYEVYRSKGISTNNLRSNGIGPNMSTDQAASHWTDKGNNIYKGFQNKDEINNPKLNDNSTVDKKDLRIKGGLGGQATAGGETNEGVFALAADIQRKHPELNRFTAFNDAYHHRGLGYHSKHQDGLATDFTVNDRKDAEGMSNSIRDELKEMGIDAQVINEYKKLSLRGTSGHIHVGFKSAEDAQRYQEISQRNADLRQDLAQDQELEANAPNNNQGITLKQTSEADITAKESKPQASSPTTVHHNYNTPNSGSSGSTGQKNDPGTASAPDHLVHKYFNVYETAY
jgi:hypothetical protein